VLLEYLDTYPQQAAKQAQVIAAKILRAMDQPYQLDGHRRHSTASIGVTLFGGAQRESIEEPLKRAELAMYQAKATGRNSLCFFEPEMEPRSRLGPHWKQICVRQCSEVSFYCITKPRWTATTD